MYNQNYLSHYGKIGMKWGHRKIQRMTEEVNTYRNRTLSDAGSMRDRANMNLNSAIKNKVDKKIIKSATDVHAAWKKSYDELKTMKMPITIKSKEDYIKAKSLIDNVGAKPLIEFEKSYGAGQSFNLVYS